MKYWSIKLWYYDWFRIVFILFGIWWQYPLAMLISELCGLTLAIQNNIAVGLYSGLFFLAMTCNNYSNLRKIGLDEYHRKLK